MKTICDEFPLTSMEWEKLEKKFDNLVLYAGWQLLKMNAKNNHTDEIEDIAQELRWAIYRAGCYYKRQVYIDDCLRSVARHVKDEVVAATVTELQMLWDNRTRHGANKVKFGPHQQELLDQIVEAHVPEDERPDRDRPLTLNHTFVTYAKSIVWNMKKSLGKKITREKAWRSGLVSLSEFDYLATG